MQFATVFLTCLVACTTATTTVRRDAKTILDILSQVKSDITKLDTSVKSFKGVNDEGPLLQASKDFISTLKSGKTKVDASDKLTLQDSLSLTGPVNDITTLGQTLESDLKSRRDDVSKLGECSVVRTQISSISSASQDLIKSVVSKVPEEAQDIAAQLSAGLTKVLKQSQDDFSEANCKDTGGSGGNGGGSSSASAPAGGSSTDAGGSGPSPTGTNNPTSAPAGGSGSTPTVGSGGQSGQSGQAPLPTETGANGSPGPSSPAVVTAGAATAGPLYALAVAAALLAF